MVHNVFQHLETFRSGSRVWRTDRRTDRIAFSNSAVEWGALINRLRRDDLTTSTFWLVCFNFNINSFRPQCVNYTATCNSKQPMGCAWRSAGSTARHNKMTYKLSKLGQTGLVFGLW